MASYLFKRLLTLLPLLLGITFLTFLIMQLAPGKPTDLITDLNAKMSLEAKQKLTKLYGLDRPWPIQYWEWLKRLSKFDFGKSFKDDRPVIHKILERLPATLLLMILFGLKIGLLPISGLRSLNFEELNFLQKAWDMLQHLLLPVSVMALTGLAALARYTRSSMLEVLHQDYIRTARAKGLKEREVIFKHAFKNALIPIITLLGLMLPELIGGSFIFETIFAYPGMGRLGFEAIMSRDYPVLMGIGTMVAFLTLLGNLLADMLYALADPRIRYK